MEYSYLCLLSNIRVMGEQLLSYFFRKINSYLGKCYLKNIEKEERHNHFWFKEDFELKNKTLWLRLRGGGEALSNPASKKDFQISLEIKFLFAGYIQDPFECVSRQSAGPLGHCVRPHCPPLQKQAGEGVGLYQKIKFIAGIGFNGFVIVIIQMRIKFGTT